MDSSGCATAASGLQVVEASQKHQNEVDALAEQFIEGDWAAGMSIALVYPDREEHYHYGVKEVGKPEVPDSETLYEIGSVTKVFTSLLLARAVVEGRLALTDPVQRCLPSGVNMPGDPKQPITFEHLATHTSGLPRMPSNFAPANPQNPYADYDPKRLHAYLNQHTLEKGPWAPYHYSNLGAGLLGYVLVQCAKATSYEALLREQVLDPLGMKTATLQPPDPGTNAATGHNNEGAPVAGWTLNVLAGAGGLRASTQEMAGFLRASMRPPDPSWAQAMELATQARIVRKWGSMGLGWHIGLGGPSPLGRVVWHNGETGGYHSFVGFDPIGQNGVVVLANTSSGTIDTLGQALLRVMSGQKANLSLPKPAVVSPTLLARYAGDYVMAPETVMTITHDDGKLYAQLTGQPRLRVWAIDSTSFAYRDVDAKLIFYPTADGSVPRLELHQNGRIVPALKGEPTEVESF